MDEHQIYASAVKQIAALEAENAKLRHSLAWHFCQVHGEDLYAWACPGCMDEMRKELAQARQWAAAWRAAAKIKRQSSRDEVAWLKETKAVLEQYADHKNWLRENPFTTEGFDWWQPTSNGWEIAERAIAEVGG